jgi:Ca2+-binding EF-hand superfamily protein
MDLIKFKNIICDLFKRETRSTPNFALIKNAFDYIDIKKDGLIDINEWSRAFAMTKVS